METALNPSTTDQLKNYVAAIFGPRDAYIAMLPPAEQAFWRSVIGFYGSPEMPALPEKRYSNDWQPSAAAPEATVYLITVYLIKEFIVRRIYPVAIPLGFAASIATGYLGYLRIMA